MDEERECPAGGDRLQLRPVTHQQDLRPHLNRVLRDAIQRESAGERGFIHDHELTLTERRAGVLVVLPPLRGVLRPDTEIVGEDLRGDRGRCETDDAAVPKMTFPRGA